MLHTNFYSFNDKEYLALASKPVTASAVARYTRYVGIFLAALLFYVAGIPPIILERHCSLRSADSVFVKLVRSASMTDDSKRLCVAEVAPVPASEQPKTESRLFPSDMVWFDLEDGETPYMENLSSGDPGAGNRSSFGGGTVMTRNLRKCLHMDRFSSPSGGEAGEDLERDGVRPIRGEPYAALSRFIVRKEDFRNG